MSDPGLEPAAESVGIFNGVVFTAIPTDLPDEELTQLVATLEEGGAQYIPVNQKTARIDDLHRLTHIVSTTADFHEYPEALENFIHVVRPTYVQQCIERGKQMNPRQFSPDHNLFLSDIVISCADIPEGDKEAIAGGVLASGGMYSGPLSKLVTHLIALSEDDERCQLARRKNLKCKILLPHWFDDCLRLGRKISEEPYLLPDPAVLRVLGKNKSDRPIQRSNDDIIGATDPHPHGFPPTPADSFDKPRQLTVFKDRRINLSTDLKIGEHLRRTITELIQSGGGHVVERVMEADTLVCQYREGADYVDACQHARDVGNLSWLYHLITHNKWTSPMRKMLHYPVPRNGIPGFNGMLISVSNYVGDARLYLENLVKACGAEFTKTMKQDNTHLITAHTASEKCDAAREWNIHVLNHLWLEESYANYQIQSLTIKKYTHFPPRTNLGEVVGQTRLDREALERNFYPRIAKKGKGKAAFLKSDTLLSEASTATGTSDSTSEPSEPQSKPGQEVDDMDVDVEPPTTIARSKRGRTGPMPAPAKDNDEVDVPTTVVKAKRSRTDPGPKTPALRKFVDSEKENDTPLSTGSRGAKARANAKLHEQAADIALYDKERKRVGGVTHGREGRASTLDPDTPAGKKTRGRKRQSTEMEDAEADEDEEEAASAVAGPKEKKAKTEKLPPISYRMVLTGYQRWVDNPKVETTERNVLRNLGIHLVDDTTNVDILCAPRIVRTKKFVCALASAPHVVTTSFLDYCLKNKKVPDPSKYPLQDRENEAKFGINLSDSVDNAVLNQKQLLHGWQIFSTQEVNGGFDVYKAIIEANGGTAMLYKGRTAMNVSKRSFDAGEPAAESQGNDTGNTLFLLSGDKPAEVALWDKFRLMAKAADMVPVITHPNWLLSVAMRHIVHWDPEQWEWKAR